MRSFKLFGVQFILRVRKNLKKWAITRGERSIRIDLGKVVFYKMGRGTFWSMTRIVDNKGTVSVA